ncbi:unnamed protein product [Tenebrio molitor]|nr:unnamed protein product [Tenebrio molitor]
MSYMVSIVSILQQCKKIICKEITPMNINSLNQLLKNNFLHLLSKMSILRTQNTPQNGSLAA